MEAYDLLKEIYLERGYSLRQIPRLILERNIFAIDIDDRAVQLAGFAIAMKARADDRDFFKSDCTPSLNVLAIQESGELDSSELAKALTMEGKFELVANDDLLPDTIAQMPLASKRRETHPRIRTAVETIVELFRRGKTTGSLSTVSAEEANAAATLRQVIAEEFRGNIFEKADRAHAISVLTPLLRQTELLGSRYDAVIMNPPYMGGKYFCTNLKSFVAKKYKGSKGDLYACFISRGMSLAKPDARIGMITIPNWMFLSTYADLRSEILMKTSVASLMHNGRGVWGADFGSCSFVLRNGPNRYYKGSFRRLFERQGEVQANDDICGKFFTSETIELDGASFQRLPGNPFAYWISDQMRAAFSTGVPLGGVAPARQGLATADNDRFVRAWYEVDYLPLNNAEIVVRKPKPDEVDATTAD